LLDLPPDVTAPSLKDVIVNLNLTKFEDDRLVFSNSERCHYDPTSELAPERAMEIQATDLANRLKDPNMVRVIYRSNVYHNTVAIDVLTGRRMVLPPFLPWDVQGALTTDLFQAGQHWLAQLTDNFQTGTDFWDHSYDDFFE